MIIVVPFVRETFEKASSGPQVPTRIPDTSLAFMFESTFLWKLTEKAVGSKVLQKEYEKCWEGIKTNFKGPQ
jgi:homogentisate 1,2-dioxygenase